MSKKIFISDVHLGAGRFSEESQDKNKYPCDWDRLSSEETDNFVNFIRFLYSKYIREIDAVVLLGDIFDNWVFPHDLTPPSIEELLMAKKNLQVAEELKTLSSRTKVYYIPGNHDMHATAEIIKKYFPDMIYCPRMFSGDRLIAEHGHRYALFNAPARFSQNIMGLPLGYFISRIEATKKGMTGSDDRYYHTYVDDFIEMFGDQTLPQSVFEAVIEEAGLNENISFSLSKTYGNDQPVSAKEVKDIYKNIYNDWPTSVVSKQRAVFAEMDMLEPIADRICKDGYYQVCIFGHSHKSEIDCDKWFVNDRIYANCGYWCGSKCTFVETEKTDRGYNVSTVKWLKDGDIRRLRSESI